MSTAQLQKSIAGSFFRGLAVLSSASLLQTLITFAAAPFLARLFTPDEFGIAGIVQVLGAIPLLMATGQYYLALGLANRQTERLNIVGLSTLLSLFLAIIFFTIILFLQKNQAIMPEFLWPAAAYFWSIPAMMVVGGILLVTRLWEIRQGSYHAMVANRMIESGGIAGAQLLLGVLGLSALGLIIGRVVGTALAATHGLKLFLSQVGLGGLRSIRTTRLIFVLRRYWQLPAYQLPAQATGVLSKEFVLPMLLALFYSMASVGYFWFATRLLERPALVFGSNVGRVFYQQAAELRQAGKPVFSLFCKSTLLLAIVSFVPFALIVVYGPDAFAIVFGPEWVRAGHYARWIAIASFASLIAFPARTVTVLFGIQRSFAIIEASRAVGGALVFVLVANHGGSELLAIAATATTQSIGVFGFVVFSGLYLKRLENRTSWTSGSRTNRLTLD